MERSPIAFNRFSSGYKEKVKRTIALPQVPHSIEERNEA